VRKVVVKARPSVNFINTRACDNELLTVSDATVESTDRIVSRKWYLASNYKGSGNKVVTPVISGNLPVTLITQTQGGCIDSVSRVIAVNKSPYTEIGVSNDYGQPGEKFNFTTTHPQSKNLWYINETYYADTVSVDLAFANSGKKQLGLISVNEFECSDTTFQSVLVENMVVDVGISKMQLVENTPGIGTIVLYVFNHGSLPIEQLNFKITLETQFSIIEQIKKRIDPGTSNVIQLASGIPVVATSTSTLCVEVGAVSTEPDQNDFNNEVCSSVAAEVVFEPPYPNPATNQITLKFIMPEDGDVSIKLLDLSGKLMISENYNQLASGLITFIIGLDDVEAGMYLLDITAGNTKNVSRIVVQ
jgi:hypothetical protein